MLGAIAAYQPREIIIYGVDEIAIERQQALDRELATATEEDNIESVRAWIDEGADPSARQSLPLMNAAEHNHTEMMFLLLNKGSKADDSSSMALYQATIQSHHIKSPDKTASTVRLLLEWGAKPNTEFGYKALENAVTAGDIYTAIVLLEAMGKAEEENTNITEEKKKQNLYGQILKKFKVKVDSKYLKNTRPHPYPTKKWHRLTSGRLESRYSIITKEWNRLASGRLESRDITNRAVRVREDLADTKKRFVLIIGDIKQHRSNVRSLGSSSIRTLNQFLFEHGFSSGKAISVMNKLLVPPLLKDLSTATETHYYLPPDLNLSFI